MSSRNRKPTAKEVVQDEVLKVEEKIKHALTVAWDDLPLWQQDNHYIISGYRPASNSFQKSFASLSYLHNESVNIYSHLLGGISFSIVGVLLYRMLVPRYETAGRGDILAFACFFAGAALCLGMSGTYHTISNHSHLVARFGNKLDYVGIVFLITGSFIPSVFYGFYCHPQLQELYWTMVRTLAMLYISENACLLIIVDMLTRSWMCYCVHIRQVSNSGMATISSWHVRGHGNVCCVPHFARYKDVWSPRYAKSHRSQLDGFAGNFIYYGSRTICCK